MYNLSTVKVEREHTFISLIFRLFLVNNERKIGGSKSDHLSDRFRSCASHHLPFLKEFFHSILSLQSHHQQCKDSSHSNHKDPH